LLKNYLRKICSKFLWAILFVDIDKFYDFLSLLSSQSFIFKSDLLISLLQIDEFFINVLKSILKLLNFGLIGIKKRNESEFILMKNGMHIDSCVQFNIFISWFDFELIVERSQLVTKPISWIILIIPMFLSWRFYLLRSWFKFNSCWYVNFWVRSLLEAEPMRCPSMFALKFDEFI